MVSSGATSTLNEPWRHSIVGGKNSSLYLHVVLVVCDIITVGRTKLCMVDQTYSRGLFEDTFWPKDACACACYSSASIGLERKYMSRAGDENQSSSEDSSDSNESSFVCESDTSESKAAAVEKIQVRLRCFFSGSSMSQPIYDHGVGREDQ